MYLIVSLYFITTTASKEVVRKEIQQVITDEGFNLPSENLKKMQENQQKGCWSGHLIQKAVVCLVLLPQSL